MDLTAEQIARVLTNYKNKRIRETNYYHNVTKNKDEWYFATVIDTYGNKYDNWFEHAHEANNWIYYIWEKEEWFNSTNSQELLANAVAELARVDEELNVRKII